MCEIDKKEPSVDCINNSFNSSSAVENMQKISIIVQNIRSMRKNFDNFLTHLSACDSKPEFIFLTEIWVYDDEIDLYKIDNYVCHSKCNNDYASGGVAVFCRNDMRYTFLSISFVSADILRLDTSVDNKNLIFICVYRLHAHTVNNFISELSIYLNTLKGKNIIILGDINIDILQPVINNSALDYLDLLSSFGFDSLVRTITRPSSETCIDHVFSRTLPCLIVESSVFDYNITDHSLILINILHKEPNKVKLKISGERKIDFLQLNDALKSESWNEVYHAEDVNKAFDVFLEVLNRYIHKFSSQNKYRNNKYNKLKPWITSELISKINYKNSMYKKMKKHSTDLSLKTEYNNIVKSLNREIAKTKETYYFEKFRQNGNDAKKNWNLVNNIISNNQNSFIPEKIVSDNHLILNQHEIAEEFNMYFTNITHELKNDVSSSNASENTSNAFSNNTFFLKPIHEHEILKIINSLENKTSTDCFGLSNALVKHISVNIIEIITYIFNLSLSSGVVPDKLKIAVVIPLFKNGDKLFKENYRPISLLPIFSKILEKIMKSRILNFLDENNFFNSNQFGFREGLSTEGALTEFLNQIYTGLNDDQHTSGIFIDVKKAFDMVDHKILLQKLYNAGFRGVSQDWFSSYFDKRKQCVKVGESISGFQDITIGVPQGSVLGPILFLIYLNSIFELPFKGKIVAFADDMALAYLNSEKQQMVNDMNSDLNLVSNWFKAHELILSEKTKVMLFKIGSEPDTNGLNFTYHFNCMESCCSKHCVNIEIVKEFKYLGITLDCNLNWKKHVNNVSKHLNILLRKFYMLRNLCPTYILKCVYYSLVQSKVEYGLACWGGVYESVINRIVKIQKHILRVIFFKPRISSSWPIFVNCKILPFRHLYYFKVLNLLYSRSGNRGFKINKHYNCRSNSQRFYVLPRTRKEHFRRYLLLMAPFLFNQLPENIRKCEKKYEFLKEVKKWLLQLQNPELLLKLLI